MLWLVLQALQVGDQVVELLVAELAQAGDVVGAVGAGQGLAEGLGAAVVEVGVLVVDAAERRGVVAAVGVVGLFEAGLVDLAVGELGAAVAGVAGGLGRRKTSRPRWAAGRQAAVGIAVGVPGVFERAQVGDQRLDVVGLGPGALACSW